MKTRDPAARKKGDTSARGLRILGVGLLLLWNAAMLLLPGLTRGFQSFFYQAFLSAAPVSRVAPASQVVETDPESSLDALEKLARAKPSVVALDPDLWQSLDGKDQARLLSFLRNLPVVLGWSADPEGAANPPPETAAPLPNLSTLEGVANLEDLPRLRLRDAAGANRGANVTAGFTVPAPGRLFALTALARGETGCLPSLALEALRRSRDVTPDHVAYVDGIGLLVGKQLTLPMAGHGLVPLRFQTSPPISALRLGEEPIRTFLAGKIVFVGSTTHTVNTVTGKKLAAETWASLVDDAVAGSTPRFPPSSRGLAAAVALAGSGLLAWALAVGLGGFGVAGLALGLALLYPAASLGFFLGAQWWLPPEQPFFAILGSGMLAWIFARATRAPASPIPAANPNGFRVGSAGPAKSVPPPGFSDPGNVRPTGRLRTQRAGERVGTPAAPDPGLERDAQGGLIRIGRYSIVRKMGAGSAGDVFEGLDTQMSRRVAIKTMQRGAALHFDHALERFAVEAKAAGSLNHPNINTIYDSGTYRDVSFMVLEYLDGLTLSQWMRNHAPLPPQPAAVKDWVRQIASALDYAHEHRVIHRDLKPANLMVVDGGHTMKLLDFGVAKFEDVMLTQTGMTVGTPSYMSPEQLQGEKVTAATDQYSLAVLLYQLLSYRLPYAGTRIPEICGRILKNELIPLTEANPNLDPAYWETLQIALRKDPAHRYPSCLALFEAWERIPA